MRRAILTIDDVPSKNTPAIVDYLTEKKIPAILFVWGENLNQYPQEGRYLLRPGIILGNHSQSHPHFSELTLEEAIEEIQGCERRIEELYASAGQKRRYRPFRFPYGDKGGKNKEKLQAYLAQAGFHKVEDTLFSSYPWWKGEGLDGDLDTYWTYDFEEYKLRPGMDFTREDIWNKIHNPKPPQGAPLLGENAAHLLLLHAHDETEELYPGYYRHMLDFLLEEGFVFEAPLFRE